MSTPPVRALPPPHELERTCRGLATLDAILSPEWQWRYFSFNAAWNAGERMASMRNGEGDEWFLVFGPGGTFFKAFWHEHPRSDAAVIYAGLPGGLAAQLVEPAFSMSQVTFGGWHDEHGWTLRGDPEPMQEELAILTGAPAVYQAYAAAYFELEVPIDAVAHVLAGLPLDDALCARLRAGCTVDELASDLAEIGYGSPAA